MRLNKALKEKNKLVKEVNDLFEVIKKYNSNIEGAVNPYNIEERYINYNKKVEELVALKVKIQKANGPIIEQIVKMSELKSMIKNMKTIPVKEGIVEGKYGTSENKYTCYFNDLSLKNEIKLLEQEIEELQETIDTHNATVSIF